MQHIFSDNSLLFIFLLCVVSLGVSVYTLVAIRRLNSLKSLFFKGTMGEDLEAIIHSLHNGHQELLTGQGIAEQHIAKLYEQSAQAVQKIGVIRFNPFNDGGGNFSFSVALLNAHNNGVVITSMYGRQQNRIYSKKIQNGTSETPLTEEEEQAVQEASYSI